MNNLEKNNSNYDFEGKFDKFILEIQKDPKKVYNYKISEIKEIVDFIIDNYYENFKKLSQNDQRNITLYLDGNISVPNIHEAFYNLVNCIIKGNETEKRFTGLRQEYIEVAVLINDVRTKYNDLINDIKSDVDKDLSNIHNKVIDLYKNGYSVDESDIILGKIEIINRMMDELKQKLLQSNRLRLINLLNNINEVK